MKECLEENVTPNFSFSGFTLQTADFTNDHQAHQFFMWVSTLIKSAPILACKLPH